MYAQQTQQEEQKLYQLQGEVRLLTTRKDNLLKELERLQVVKSKEIPQLKEQTKLLQDEREGLLKQVDETKKDLTSLGLSIENARRGLKFFTEGQIAQINADISTKMAQNGEVAQKLALKEAQLTELAQTLDDAELELIEHSKKVLEQERENTKKENELIALSDKVEIMGRRMADNLAKAEDELESLHSQIKTEKIEAEELRKQNIRVTTDIKNRLNAMDQLTRDVERQKKEAEAKLAYNAEWQKRLDEQQAFINRQTEQLNKNLKEINGSRNS